MAIGKNGESGSFFHKKFLPSCALPPDIRFDKNWYDIYVINFKGSF
jgi:hypothetical protein